MPVSSRRQKGGLGPFAQQMALYSLAPLATEAVGNLLGNIVPGLVAQGGARAFDLPGNSRMIGLPNHLPPNTYYQLPHPSQKGGLVFPQRKKKTRTKRVGEKKKGKRPFSKRRTRPSGRHGWFEFGPDVVKFFDASTTTSHATPISHASTTSHASTRSIKEEETLSEKKKIMAPPVGAWRCYPPNRHLNPSLAAAKRLNDGFTARPTRPRLKAKTKTRAP